MPSRFIDPIIDIAVFKIFPAFTGFFAFVGVGGGVFGVLWALFVALSIKVVLYFFEAEIKAFSVRLRKRWDKFRKSK